MSSKLLQHLTECLFLNRKADKTGDYLSAISRDEGSSSITRNEIMKNKKYDLTVIIPVYNTEAFLDKCLQSVLNEKTEYSICVTIINDGSTDNSEAIIQQYSDEPGVRVIRQENRGLSGARNAGLKRIESRYVTFIDSDDCLPENGNSLDILIRTADRLNADIVQGGWETFTDDGNMSVVQKTVCPDAGKISGYAWGKIYRSDLWNDICFPEKYWYEDTLINMLIYSKCKKAVTVDSIVYRYRINPSGINLSSLGNPKSLDSLYITRLLINDRISLGIPMTERDLDIFFSQIRMNIRRTLPLRDAYLQKCMFEEHRSLYLKAFSHLKTKDVKNRLLERALSQGSFRKYIIATAF